MTTWSFFADHRAEILAATLDHLALVVIAMIIAILIGVPLGMFIVQRPALRTIALGIASIFQTIPSLALFGFLIPIPYIGGIGKRTAAVALVLYALLPILRNTYVPAASAPSSSAASPSSVMLSSSRAPSPPPSSPCSPISSSASSSAVSSSIE